MNKFFITVIFPHIPITSKLTDVIWARFITFSPYLDIF